MSWRSGSSSSEPPPRSSPAGTGSRRSTISSTGRSTSSFPSSAFDVAGHARRRLHALRDAGRPARPRPVASGRGPGSGGRGVGGGPARPRRDRCRRRPRRRPQRERSRMTIDPGATLGVIRERKPLVHNITNYVVMNETANAILALGALPVMAHAREEVAEMVGLAGALVLNIGTLSEPWIDAMLIAGKAANERRRAGRARSRRRRCDGVPDRDGAAAARRDRRGGAARERGRGGDARRCRGGGARRRVGRRRRRPGRARA